MRNLKSVAMLPLVLLLAGCIQTSATLLSSTKYPPIPPEQVTIYLAEADIPRTYEKLAILNAEGQTGWTNEKQMYEALKKRAAKIGANGILFQPIDEPGQGAKIAGAVLGTGTARKAEMIAIFVQN